MKLILTQDVENLGAIGDVVKTKNGYARNYLLPRSLAVVADESNQRDLDHKRRVLEKKKKKILASFKDMAKKIEGMLVTVAKQVGDENKIFGSVTSAEIANDLAQKGLEIAKKDISFEESIKKTGTYYASVKLHTEVTAKLKVEVVPS